MELTHEEVGAEYVSANVWGANRTQLIAIDDNGEMFRKRHYDEHSGGTNQWSVDGLFARISSPDSPDRHR